MSRSQRKVAHVSSMHRWFDERIFQKEAKSLAKAGYEVVYLVQHDKEETVDGIRLVPLLQHKNAFQRVFRTGFHLFRAALREKAAVYHLHDPDLLPVGLLLKLAGKKVIYDVHEDYQYNILAKERLRGLRGPLAAAWRGFEKVCTRLFDWTLAVDSRIAEKFPPAKTTVISNVPPLSFMEVTKQHARDGKLKIVFLGLIAARRGIYQLVEAMDYVRNPAAELHVMGSLNDAQLQERFAAHPRIVYHGRLPWEQLKAELAGADVGVLLFQPDRALLNVSGGGNTKLFEFMAVGLPVLISDFPNLRATVDPIGACLPVDPTDPRKIAEAIDYLYEHPEVRRAMGENGRKAVRDRFNWEHEEKKLLEVYRTVLSRNA